MRAPRLLITPTRQCDAPSHPPMQLAPAHRRNGGGGGGEVLTSREELLAGCRRASASLPSDQPTDWLPSSGPDSRQSSPYPGRAGAAGCSCSSSPLPHRPLCDSPTGRHGGMGLSTLIALGAHDGAMAPPLRPPSLQQQRQQLQESPRVRGAAGGSSLFAPAPRGGAGAAAYAGTGVGSSGLEPPQYSSDVEPSRGMSNAPRPYATSTRGEVGTART